MSGESTPAHAVVTICESGARAAVAASILAAAIMVIEHVLSPDAVDRSLQPAA